jgi:hypothetical protein
VVQVIPGSLRRQKLETVNKTVQDETWIGPAVLAVSWLRSLGHNEQADRLPTHARPHDTESRAWKLILHPTSERTEQCRGTTAPQQGETTVQGASTSSAKPIIHALALLTSLVSIINPRVILQPAYALLFLSTLEEPLVVRGSLWSSLYTLCVDFRLPNALSPAAVAHSSHLHGLAQTSRCCPHHHRLTYTDLHEAVRTPRSLKMEGLPTPPNEDHLRSQGPKRQHSHSKAVKAVHRASKRATTHGHPASPAPDAHSHVSSADGRHKRVWKACERCRMKKTKVN